jgi:cobalt/nickel transport system permease protein
MHIPDGYLSPATCAALYAGAAPFWYVALRRVRRAMHTRLVPVLSLVSAFSFVVMMFNIPLPGGTTGHAVGVGVATVMLGPAASMLAISVALVIQAFFFGDGGITAIGANCFNMAVVGSLVAHVVYRPLAGGAPLESRVRWIAAGVAGYAAVNAAALCAAIEFGIQPLFYRDATGAPLYAPYPLSVAIPAMMIGHLAVAGVAEGLVSAGIVAFVQRADRALLRLNPVHAAGAAGAPGGGRALRSLWLALALLMLLTPIGILATGTAWGEWAASDFGSASGRAEIAATSLDHAPPGRVPAGLERLSSAWTAPWAGYAPDFVRSPAVGYALSAMFGVGLVVLVSEGIGRLVRLRREARGRRGAEGAAR